MRHTKNQININDKGWIKSKLKALYKVLINYKVLHCRPKSQDMSTNLNSTFIITEFRGKK